MAITVALKNPNSGEIKLIKVGWSWTLFFFSPFFGIPVFRRGLIAWGYVFLTLSVLAGIGNLVGNDSGGIAILLLVNIVDLVLMIFMGIKGNEMTAKNYLARGWRFLEPNSDTTRFAKMNWQLSDQTVAQPVAVD
jgi:hypothetical protein